MSRLGQPVSTQAKARTHGLLTLRRHLMDLGSRAIDGRSTVGIALRKWRQELIEDLGGEDSLSRQELSLIELAARSKIMLDSVDNWIVSQPSLINGRKKSLHNVVLQRQAIASEYRATLKDLGLKRVKKELNLKDYVQQKYGQQDKDQEE